MATEGDIHICPKCGLDDRKSNSVDGLKWNHTDCKAGMCPMRATIVSREPTKKTVIASPEHVVFYDELITLMDKHGAALTEMQCLAIAANVVGKILAMQNPMTTTREMAMDVVATNIERGNQEALACLMKTAGSA